MTGHSHTVRGVDVGPETRCRHYRTELDVIAIRFPCCDTFFPCFECHAAVTDHDAERWGADDSTANAVLCGVCGSVLTVREYVDCGDDCPECGAAFNPGCRTHYDRYFVAELFAESDETSDR